ncbi:MAG: type restriction enzyme subunit [Candidatus Petromonas sp.]|nr:type restriction enzyme subunit [Candidatus Petromonas sp.]
MGKYGFKESELPEWFATDELNKFAHIYFKQKDKKTSKDRAMLNHFIDVAVERFKKLDKQRKQDFSSQSMKYVRLYSFILQITPFEDVELHKLYVYLTYLLKKLPKEKGSTVHLADEIALEYYATKKTFDDFRLAFEKVFINKVIDRMDQNQTFFTRILDDEQFKNALMEFMLVETYEKLNNMTI